MILLDSSTRMSEKSFDLAMETAFNILDTLGENDYVNLVTLTHVPKSPVPCFKDRMVRATPDNLLEIKSAVKAVKLSSTVNFTAGLEYAFSLLHKVCPQFQINLKEALISPDLSKNGCRNTHVTYSSLDCSSFSYLIDWYTGVFRNLLSIKRECGLVAILWDYLQIFSIVWYPVKMPGYNQPIFIFDWEQIVFIQLCKYFTTSSLSFSTINLEKAVNAIRPLC